MLWRMESESVSESGLAKGCFGAKAFYWGNAMLGMGRHAGVGYKAGAINSKLRLVTSPLAENLGHPPF
ncbi:hypothetical protein D3C80_743060 [compost metagenome]